MHTIILVGAHYTRSIPGNTLLHSYRVSVARFYPAGSNACAEAEASGNLGPVQTSSLLLCTLCPIKMLTGECQGNRDISQGTSHSSCRMWKSGEKEEAWEKRKGTLCLTLLGLVRK